MGFLKIIIGILVFSLIVIIHEAGHFIAANAFGVKVLEFSLGLGPKIISIPGRLTTYCLKAIPFGGSCLMKGEYDLDEDSDKQKVPDEDDFNSKPAWQRAIIIASGPFANFILAFVTAVILISSTGIDKPVISDVMDGYPAQEAGISAGDTIVSLNSRKICVYRDITLYLNMHPQEDIDVVFIHNNETIEKTIVPRYDEESGRYLMGIISNSNYVKPSDFLECLEYGLYEVRLNILSALDSISYILHGKSKMSDFMGPVGMVAVVGDSVETSLDYGFNAFVITILDYIVLFSANIGVMNLLPIPALDGGRILFCIIEMITGRKRPAKIENYINIFFFILLIVFMIVVMFNDVIRLIV